MIEDPIIPGSSSPGITGGSIGSGSASTSTGLSSSPDVSTSTESYSGGGTSYGSGSGTSQVQQSAEQVKQSAQSEINRIKGAAREHGAAAFDQVRSGAQQATRQARDLGTSFVATQKGKLADRVTEFADAARSASECLSSGEHNLIAGPATMAADQLGRVATYLRDSDPADLLDDVETFARRRPEVVFGGLFLLGLAASRFLKASSRRRPDYSSDYDADYEGRGSYEGYGGMAGEYDTAAPVTNVGYHSPAVSSTELAAVDPIGAGTGLPGSLGAPSPASNPNLPRP